MQTITCSNDECGVEIEFDLSIVKVEESQNSGNHTTQYSGSGSVECKECTTETDFSCLWDELDDTGEVLSFEFT